MTRQPRSRPGTTQRLLALPAPAPAGSPSTGPVGRAAVVVNPAKFPGEQALARLRTEVEREFSRLGWQVVSWSPTTAATCGRDEARQALDAGADLVLVAGGDGTVRAVAGVLVGTGVALGVLPCGTGNLLARNLGIPLDDVAGAVRTACTGVDGAVDVGRLEVDRDGEGTAVEQHLFLVMAGAGFDAAMIAGAGEGLKRRIGHAAYLVSGIGALRGPSSHLTVRADGGGSRTHATRGVVVGNCGRLTMGLTLMPGADPGDGVLDGVVLPPRGLVRWARALWSVAAGPGATQRLLPRLRASGFEVRSDVELPVQVDGDVVGRARRIRLWASPAALRVRRPAARSSRRHPQGTSTPPTVRLSLVS
ncbi:diacylglycerol/lipid kinase family protein [Kineococcus sp. SYSU DK001]|uniref:diacylglycerol/lipid kinase family protein n=1 Tax=Kineococcus sp. SYSU DK001 TaxID=3383122 RepID=UPI003D7D4862